MERGTYPGRGAPFPTLCGTWEEIRKIQLDACEAVMPGVTKIVELVDSSKYFKLMSLAGGGDENTINVLSIIFLSSNPLTVDLTEGQREMIEVLKPREFTVSYCCKKDSYLDITRLIAETLVNNDKRVFENLLFNFRGDEWFQYRRNEPIDLTCDILHDLLHFIRGDDGLRLCYVT